MFFQPPLLVKKVLVKSISETIYGILSCQVCAPRDILDQTGDRVLNAWLGNLSQVMAHHTAHYARKAPIATWQHQLDARSVRSNPTRRHRAIKSSIVYAIRATPVLMARPVRNAALASTK